MFSFAIITLGVLSLTHFTSGVAPLHGGVLFPRFQEFPEAAVSADGSIGVQNIDESPAARFRLPNQIVPRHYKLEIRPILNEGEEGRFTAPGVVQITVECLQATNNLVLHAAELTINTTSLKVSRGENPNDLLSIRGTSANEVNETFTIEVVETLTVGSRYDITIEYVAIIADPAVRMNGIYWSSYLNDLNERRYLATTQFSRTRAFRKTLPSFDEPSQKASFEISIGRQEPYHTLCNMDIRLSEPISGMDGWFWDRYHTTPVMPATVIAMIVSDFVDETADADLFHPDKPVKIWGPPPDMKRSGAAFAAQAAARILKHFEEYFEIEYELPKIDSVCIPDFAAGAMENWGLNTYRTIYLIWNQGINTAAEKFRSGNIIGHELAHQYWGNLVTHAWWNDWWLTEGFASYFEYTSLQYIHPEFEANNRIVTSDMQPAMEYDSGPNSVPIHGNVTWDFVENPSVINYNKGASIVRMMQAFLSEEVFRKALSFYLRKRSYEAVHQDALFDDLNEYLEANNATPSNGKTMKEIMDTWTLQTSYPLIRVTRAGSNRIFISQERYRNANMGQEVIGEPLWHVPIAYITQSNPSFDEQNFLPKLWMDNSIALTNHEVDTNQWLVLNPDGRSYYRVLYDSHFGSLLSAQLISNISSISIGSRSMIVDDYFTSAYQGYITIQDALQMTRFMANETDYNVWVPFMKHLRKAFDMFSSDQQQFDAFKAYIVQSMQVVFIHIGFRQLYMENPYWTITRAHLFDWACVLDSPGCVFESQRLLAVWGQNPSFNPVPVDLRPYIYCAAAKSPSHWPFLEAQYLATNDSLLRNSLACTDNVAILQNLLKRVLSDPAIPEPDSVPLIQRIAMNSVARSFVIDLLQNSILDMIYSTRVGVNGVAAIINTLTTYIRSTEELTRLQTIVTNNNIELLSQLQNINTYLARIPANQQWMTSFGNSIYTWMASQ